MTDQTTLKRHAALLDNMASALGIDLEQATLSAQLPFDQVADAVLRCTGCSAPDHCAHSLDQGGARTSAPGYCRNRDLLAALKPTN
ncbi:DUF6455 family protein [Arenibacterium sp. CAU 1754]